MELDHKTAQEFTGMGSVPAKLARTPESEAAMASFNQWRQILYRLSDCACYGPMTREMWEFLENTLTGAALALEQKREEIEARYLPK